MGKASVNIVRELELERRVKASAFLRVHRAARRYVTRARARCVHTRAHSKRGNYRSRIRVYERHRTDARTLAGKKRKTATRASARISRADTTYRGSVNRGWERRSSIRRRFGRNKERNARANGIDHRISRWSSASKRAASKITTEAEKTSPRTGAFALCSERSKRASPLSEKLENSPVLPFRDKKPTWTNSRRSEELRASSSNEAQKVGSFEILFAIRSAPRLSERVGIDVPRI